MTHKNDTPIPITVELHPETLAYLQVLAKANHGIADTVAGLLNWFACCAADGMRRPGAWERGWISQCCGTEWESLLEQIPGIPYRSLRPKVSP